MNKAFKALINQFYNRDVSPHDQALLDLVFNPDPSQADVDACLAKADIEVLGADKALLLSYFFLEHPDLKPDDYTGPRLKGLIRYYHFRNTATLAHLSRIGKALNEAHIPFLLFKGGAMKVLRPDLPRPMGDTDILLPKGTLNRAVKICEDLGYQHIHGKPTHAVGMHTDKEDAVDLHYHFFDEGRDQDQLERDVFRRAKLAKAFGCEFLLPCHEDLFFLVLNNFTKNLRERTTLGGLFYALCDCHYLLKSKPDFSFEIVRQDASLGAKELETRFGAQFMDKVVPGLIPNLDQNLPFTDKVNEFCNLLIFDYNVYRPLRQICQAMRVAELRNYPMMNGKRILKFLVFDKLRRRPWFVSWYINKRMSERWLNAH